MNIAVPLGLVLLGAASLFGQHPSSPPQHGNAPPSGFKSGFRTAPRSGFRRSYEPYGVPLWPAAYDYDYYGYSPAPGVVVVQQPPAYVIVPEIPVQPPALEIHEYNHAQSTAAAAEDGEEPAFSLVLKDGSVHSAIAVTAQNEIVHYVEPDGRHQRISLTLVDREATARLNRAHKLVLQLPAPER